MLEAQCRKDIQKNGPFPQSRLMEKALYHYYCSEVKLGQDFTTAPEVSQVFGELIGIWLVDIYAQLGSPQKITLVELGPGKGTLMADVLRVIRKVPSFLEALDIYLVEVSPLLRAIQKTTVHHSAVTWVERLEDVPSSSAPLLILANEFLDALPTTCYVRKENRLYERWVGLRDNQLSFFLKEIREDRGSDKTWEESQVAGSLIQNICKRLLLQKGIFLCLDYGYEKGEGETLQAIFKGNPIDPLTHLGQADMTCHVNFGQLKTLAQAAGVKVLGPCPQGLFLKRLHMKERIERLKQANPSQRSLLEAAYRRLTHPSQMGLLFKSFTFFSPSFLHPLGFHDEN